MRTINLCADDFGYHPAINQAVLGLLSQGRLSATSVMTNAPYAERGATDLKRWASLARVGLHINLTEFEAASPAGRSVIQPLKSLMYQAYRRRLSSTAVAEEIEAQLQLFIDYFGQLPSFIDGHQHVHQLPGVRRALLNIYRRYYPDATALVRLPKQRLYGLHPRYWRLGLKPWLIRLTGAKRLGWLLTQNGIPHNTSFSGIYHFNSDSYRHYFQAFLEQIDHEGWLMCHPAATIVPDDVIANARVQEYAYLSSLAFNEDCHWAKVQLA